jgi:hypothetical protein
VQVVLEHSGEHLSRGHVWSVCAGPGRIASIAAGRDPLEDRSEIAAKNNAIAELARCDVATREIPDRRLLREVTFDG